MAAVVEAIVPEDIPRVAAFLARQARVGEAVIDDPLPPEQRLRWLLLDNPVWTTSIPLGWQIRDDDGVVVGAAICSPFRIASPAGPLEALMFSKFFVDPPFRGMGLGLLMRFVREGERFVLFCTSTNAVAGDLFKGVGARVIDGTDHTMLGVRRPAPLAEEWVFRRTGVRWLSRSAAAFARLSPSLLRLKRSASASAQLTPVNDAGDVPAEISTSNPPLIRIARDSSYLRWRYFTGERDKHVFRFEFAGEGDRMVVVNLPRAGRFGQIRVLNVLDAWPPLTIASAPVVCARLAEHFRGRYDVIWLRSQSPAVEAAIAGVGFVRHAFPAPLGWFIDRRRRLPDARWCVMPGDSE